MMLGLMLKDAPLAVRIAAWVAAIVFLVAGITLLVGGR